MRTCFRIALLSLTCAILAHSQESPPATGDLTLHDGEPVLLRIAQTLSSETAQIGQEVRFTAAKPVKIGDLLVLPKGAVATGKVAAVEKRRRKGRGGKLSICIESVQLLTGASARLRAVDTRANGTSKDMVTDMAAWTIYTAGLGAPLVPFLLLEHGHAMVIPEGTRFTAFMDGDVSLNRDAVIRSQPAIDLPNPDFATVYLYRAPKGDFHIVNPPITCGETLVGIFGPGQLQELHLPPGKYWFHAGPQTGKVLVKSRKDDLFPQSFEAGRIYYLEVIVQEHHTLRKDWEVIFRPVPPGDAEDALLDFEYRVDVSPEHFNAEQMRALRAQPSNLSSH